MYNLAFLQNIRFTEKSNIIIGIVITFINLLIFLKANGIYSKTFDKRMALFGGGFFTSSLFEILHIINSANMDFPFIFIFLTNICYVTPAFISLWLFTNPYAKKDSYFRRKTYGAYLLFFIIILFFYTFFKEGFKNVLYPLAVIELILSGSYFLLAFVYMDIRPEKKIDATLCLPLGYLFLGLNELYITGSHYILSFYRYLIHSETIIGLILIYIGLTHIQFTTKLFSIRQKLLAFPYFFIFSSFTILSVFASFLIGHEYLNILEFYFLILFSASAVFIYFMSTQITKPIKNVIDGLNNNTPDSPPTPIPVISNDEIGLLTEIINRNEELKWNYTEELKTNQERIQKLTQIKDDFIATFTHDLRSPIIAEQKALEALLLNKLGYTLDDFSEYLEDIYKTNEELLRIINNLLTVYHYESGGFRLEQEWTDISELIYNSTRTLRHLAHDVESELLVLIEEDLPWVKVDGDQIMRVLTNLISNAIKHNAAGTLITITACRKNDNIQIRNKQKNLTYKKIW